MRPVHELMQRDVMLVLARKRKMEHLGEKKQNEKKK